MHLGGITVQSANEMRELVDFNAASDSHILYKHANLSELTLFWGSLSKDIHQDAEDASTILCDDMASSQRISARQTLLYMKSAAMWANVAKKEMRPTFVDADIAPVTLTIDQVVTRDIMAAINAVASRRARSAYYHLRPELNSYSGHYSEWWNFAIQCALSQVRMRRKELSWPHILARIRIQRQYAALYRNALLNKVSCEERQEMTKIEEAESLELLVIVRDKCVRNLKMELKHGLSNTDAVGPTSPKEARAEKKGFLSRLYGRFAGTASTSASTRSIKVGNHALELSEAEIEALREFSEKVEAVEVGEEGVVDEDITFEMQIRSEKFSLLLMSAAAKATGVSDDGAAASSGRVVLTRFDVDGFKYLENQHMHGCRRQLSLDRVCVDELDRGCNEIGHVDGRKASDGALDGPILSLGSCQKDQTEAKVKFLDLVIDRTIIHESYEQTITCVVAPMVPSL